MIFMKRFGNEFAIIAIYVDNLNIIRTHKELPKAVNCLKQEFDMKNLERTKFYLGLQIEYLKNGIFMYQETCITKVLKWFYVDKLHP